MSSGINSSRSSLRCAALCRKDWAQLPIRSARLNGICSSSSSARSMREKSRMSLMTLSKCSVDSEASAAYSTCSSVMSVVSNSCSMPSTPFIGVRSSWHHHRQEVGFGVVGLFRFFAGLDQLRHRLMLFAAGLFEPLGEVVDVLRQGAQLGVIDARQGRGVVAFLDRLDRVADVADRLRQAARQAPGQQESKQKGEQREDPGLEQDFLLALAEGVVGQADDHSPQVVLARRTDRGAGVLEEVIRS